MTKPAWHKYLNRQWVCQVVRSGYHNGANCLPEDPHAAWECGWRWELSLPDTASTRRLLRVVRSR